MKIIYNFLIGKQLIGKATWNDAARNYIKKVGGIMEQLNLLFKSIEDGDTTKIKEILAKNKKFVFARDKDGRSPIHIAAQNGHSDVIKAIIAENAEYTQIKDSVIFRNPYLWIL